MEDYNAEVQQRWGQTAAYQEYTEKTKNCSENQWNSMVSGLDDIFREFARCVQRGAQTGSPEAQALVERLQAHITENFYTCTKQILAGLGQMYVADERFQNNIDRHGSGTAAFASEAIRLYCAGN